MKAGQPVVGPRLCPPKLKFDVELGEAAADQRQSGQQRRCDDGDVVVDIPDLQRLQLRRALAHKQLGQQSGNDRGTGPAVSCWKTE